MNYSTVSSLTLLISLASFVCNAFSPHHTVVCHRICTHRTAVFSPKNRGHSPEDYFNAEEAAAFDAHDLSDPGVEAAVMERAVMMAHELVGKKEGVETNKLENRTKVSEEDLAQEDATEESFLMVLDQMKQDVKDHDICEARTLYRKDPAKFKAEYMKMDQRRGTVAIQALEKLIADQIQKITDMELQLQSIAKSFFHDIHRGEMAEARAAVASEEAEAARERLHSTEGFDGTYERDERKRDFAFRHVQHDTQNFEQRVQSDASRLEKEDLLREYEMNRALESERHEKDVLSADLEEIRNMMKDQFLLQWRKE